jgi:tetratricopeptide (TPR) repeat protein
VPNWITRSVLAISGASLIAVSLHAQAPNTAPKSASSSTALQHAIDLVEQGRCTEALPVLKKQAPLLSDKQLKYHAQMATVRCSMSVGDDQTTFSTLWAMRRDFPNDPEVLYISTHFLSEMALRVSQQLAAAAPTSYQARELEAESYESQNKWEDAAAIYKQILADNPQVQGIHFRLGRVALATADTPANVEEAKKQFEQELQLDPSNASAEFWLGEIDRRAGQWNDAIPHFTSAAKLDPGFAEAYLALGMTLNATGQFADSIAPLERYTKMIPADPAGHYHLSLAYARVGRKADAAREIELQKALSEKKAAGATP